MRSPRTLLRPPQLAVMAKRGPARLLAAALLLGGASLALAAALRRSGSAGCPSPVPILHRRADIAAMLQAEDMRVGAELGVLHGTFAKETLAQWPAATQYVLVDLWAPQEHYVDLANAALNVQEDRLRDAQANTQLWRDKVLICRNSPPRAQSASRARISTTSTSTRATIARACWKTCTPGGRSCARAAWSAATIS